MIKILFVGDLNDYGRSFQRYRALISLGHNVVGLSHTPVPWRPAIDRTSYFEKITWKLKIPVDLNSINKNILNAIQKNNFEVIWIEKGNTIRPKTLKKIKKHQPNAKLVSCSEDDMYGWHNRSFFYTWGLAYYDIVFTTKVYNLDELKALGAKRVELFLDAYDESLHRPLVLNNVEVARFRADVGAAGAFEEDRAGQMLYLAERGIKITIWGNGWAAWVNKHPNLIVKNEHLFGIDYVKAICATKISLCFLRKINRDEVTSRSVEIPACGGFMIAERTKRHQDFFVDGKEAVFFDTKDELYDLVVKYLLNDEIRTEIAKAGRNRVIKSGYNHRTQLSNMLKIAVESIKY